MAISTFGAQVMVLRDFRSHAKLSHAIAIGMGVIGDYIGTMGSDKAVIDQLRVTHETFKVDHILGQMQKALSEVNGLDKHVHAIANMLEVVRRIAMAMYRYDKKKTEEKPI